MTEKKLYEMYDGMRPSAAAMERVQAACAAEEKPRRGFPRRLSICAAAMAVVLALGGAAYASDLFGVQDWVNRMLIFAGVDLRGAQITEADDFVRIRKSEDVYWEYDKNAEFLFAHAVDLQRKDNQIFLVFDERRFDVTEIFGENGSGTGTLEFVQGDHTFKLELERVSREDCGYTVTVYQDEDDAACALYGFAQDWMETDK